MQKRRRWLATTTTATARTTTMRILVTGAAGQVGQDLVPFLAQRVGGTPGAVLATDLREPQLTTTTTTTTAITTAALDVTDARAFELAAREHGATHIVHLAALLSARGELDPGTAIRVNSRGAEAALAAAARTGASCFVPSTIAAYGFDPSSEEGQRLRLGGGGGPGQMGGCSDDPRADPGRPRTLYGVTKAYAEGLGAWYASPSLLPLQQPQRAAVDFRSLRLPGVLSAAAPGGGTTDYALHMLAIAADAVPGPAATTTTTPYRCFLAAGVELPFMHGRDTLEAIWRLLTAPASQLSRRVYNVGSVSFTPAEWRAALERAVAARRGGDGGAPSSLQVEYAPDHRDAIARSWPARLDYSAAARDWGYAPSVASVDAMAEQLLGEVLEARRRLEQQQGPQARPEVAGAAAAASVRGVDEAVAAVPTPSAAVVAA